METMIEVMNKELRRGSVKVNFVSKLTEEESQEVKKDLSLIKILKKLSKSNKEVKINKEISATIIFNDLEGYLKIQFSTKSLKENFNLDFLLETKEESLVSYFYFEYLEDSESNENTFRDQYIKGVKFIRKSVKKLIYKNLYDLDYKIILNDLVEILKKSKRFFK